MRIELIPKIKVTTEEKYITDQFCEMCENFAETINDCYIDESNEIYQIIEENICLDWDIFMDTVKYFTSFIRSCEEV